jgi:hypothetical protein
MSIATIVIRIVQPPGHPICCSNVCYYSKVLLNLYVISCFVIPANAGTYKPCGGEPISPAVQSESLLRIITIGAIMDMVLMITVFVQHSETEIGGS